MANVLLKNITKKFDKIVAVNSIDLKIIDQEFVVLVGPSGCGKTTTLRMIAGLEEITEGEIYIGDKLVNDLPPKDRNIAMVFQSYALYPHMKIFDNLAFGLKMRKLPKAQRKVMVEKAAEILGIQDLLDRKPKQLSGGQRQRVALGRAIVRDPEIFLFDEPLSNLDAKLRVQMRTELKKLHERLNATVVYVTHDQVEAMTMGDRIVVMKDGIIQQVGAPLELYDRPNNIFVAGFIGSPAMNFIPCRILEENSKFYVSTDGIKISLPDSIAAKVRSHTEREFIFGFRPEDLYAKESGHHRPFQTETIRAEINVIEILGKESYLDLSAGKNSFAALIISDRDNKPHQNIDLEVNLEKIHLFSKQSGEAIV